MVHPDYRHQGFGRKLLIEIERCFPNTRYELFTSTKSLDNIRFYKSMGYEIFNQKEMIEELIFTYMQK